MSNVPDQSVGTIFAGQVVEHLWRSELVGFLFEASRTLRPGGRLIVDSPNEEIVRQTGWNHPEHTIEFRPDDAKTLLEVAGFTVTLMVGHWLCRSPDGSPLPLLGEPDESPASMECRIRDGISRPQDSFSWWIEARKDRPPNAAALVRFVDEIWRRYWLRRIHTHMFTAADWAVIDGEIVATAPEGWSGLLVFGPTAPMPPGRSLIGFDLDPYCAFESPGRIEVFKNEQNSVLAETRLPPALFRRAKVWLELDVPTTTFGLEFRLVTTGAAKLSVRLGLDVVI
jgi:hypothetical protein